MRQPMKDISLGLWTLNGGKVLLTDADAEDATSEGRIEFFISSNGGSVNDMFVDL